MINIFNFNYVIAFVVHFDGIIVESERHFVRLIDDVDLDSLAILIRHRFPLILADNGQCEESLHGRKDVESQDDFMARILHLERLVDSVKTCVAVSEAFNGAGGYVILILVRNRHGENGRVLFVARSDPS